MDTTTRGALAAGGSGPSALPPVASRRRLVTRPTDDCCAGSAVAPPSLDPSRADALAERLKALADPTRLRMLDLLAQQAEGPLPPAPLCVCDITAQFPQNQPAISHHLRLLREAGLIQGEKRGVWSYYWATAAGREALSVVQALG